MEFMKELKRVIVFVVAGMSIYLAVERTAKANDVLAADSCRVLYQAASVALDDKRSHCGQDAATDNVFCRLASQANIPIHYQDIDITINVGEAFRLLNDLGLVPNKFRRVVRLIDQAYAGNGSLLKRVARRIKRNHSSITVEQVASMIRDEDKNGGLCLNNQLTNVKGVQRLIESKL